jgi:hypothetical protein
MAEVDLERELSALAKSVAWPATPSLAPTVTSRLLAECAAGARPPLPRRATWTARRRIVVAIAAAVALLALAAGARFVVGSEEIVVRPGVTPSGPPLSPAAALGEPVSLHDAEASAGFDVALPLGRPPDAVYRFHGNLDGRGILLAWNADDRAPALPGTPWGLVLMETTTERDVVVKSVNDFSDIRRLRFEGGPAFWIDSPHELLVSTASGTQTFDVTGNVLVWARDGVTYRLESALSLPRALALARTIG